MAVLENSVHEAISRRRLAYLGTDLAVHTRGEPVIARETIRRLFRAAGELRRDVGIVHLEDHEMDLAGLLTAGVDLWLNTPLSPLEASGTSGMKAAHNGVPSFSILDGWWVEGHIERVTGWSVGPARGGGAPPLEDENARDAAELYEKLGNAILLSTTTTARVGSTS